jgi:hypothetical protein
LKKSLASAFWFLLAIFLLAGNASAVIAPHGQIVGWDALTNPESLLRDAGGGA